MKTKTKCFNCGKVAEPRIISDVVRYILGEATWIQVVVCDAYCLSRYKEKMLLEKRRINEPRRANQT